VCVCVSITNIVQTKVHVFMRDSANTKYYHIGKTEMIKYVLATPHWPPPSHPHEQLSW
jgi:hypothetical protein